jgi:hypothetical protein
MWYNSIMANIKPAQKNDYQEVISSNIKRVFWNQSLDNLVIERVNPLDFYKEEIEASIEDKE